MEKEQFDPGIIGGFEVDVVEAACYAHDLGHPPFGHTGEKALNELLKDQGCIEGYEGNAQTFRIVNKLCLAYRDRPGLNLTRATLNGILKYPWFKDEKADHPGKFGAYQSERDEFSFARDGFPFGRFVRSLEASIMDLADDITYAVHDLEDFYRAGLVPMSEIKNRNRNLVTVLQKADDDWLDDNIRNLAEFKAVMEMMEKAIAIVPFDLPYIGTGDQRLAVHSFSSFLLREFMDHIHFRPPTGAEHDGLLVIDGWHGYLIHGLKNISCSIFESPTLIRQQYGERRIVHDLFQIFEQASKDKDWYQVLPARCRELIIRESGGRILQTTRARAIADSIASLTDDEAIKLHQKITGIKIGSMREQLAF